MAQTLNIAIENDAGDEWLTYIMSKGEETSDNQLEKPKIFQKVPRILREIDSNKTCYDPLVVSIGPHHHGKVKFNEMQRLKELMACQFVKDSEKPIEVLYEQVKEAASSARKCYAEDVTKKFDDKEFTQMLFLDGCFILQFIFCYLHKRQNLKMNSQIEVYFIKRDLFLLENQLPFQVLKSLMNLRFKEEVGRDKKLIKDFIKHIRALPSQQDSYKESIMRFIWPSQSTTMTTKQEIEDHEPAHLLDFFRTQFISKQAPYGRTKRNDYDDWYSCRSAMELKTVGIHFRPSKTDLFTDVTYKSTLRGGTLKLPPIVVDDSTKSLLLNLVAYEACLGKLDELWVTSYICFLDSLIDHVDDVKELRSKGILLNILGSDQQVADLFNEIANYLVANPRAYIDVKNNIELHYKSIIKKWVSEWLHLHFRRPWTTIGFFAATIAVILTAIQTYLAAFPSKG